LDAEAQRVEDRARIRGVERAGARRARQGHMYDFEAVRRVRTCGRRRVVFDEIDREAEAACALREQLAIGEYHEPRRPLRARGLQAQLRPDTRGLSRGERQRRLSQRRIST